MVKASESALKIVTVNKRKWLKRLNQKVSEAGATSYYCAAVAHGFPVDSRHLTRRTSHSGTWKPRIASDPRAGTAHREVRPSRCGFGRSEEAKVVL